MTKDKRESILRPEGIKKLLEGGGKKLTEDQRALLLALASVDADNLSEEEQKALEKLRAQMKKYDTTALEQAVEHMMTAEPIKERKVEWPELKKRRKKSSK
jgi:hypothetical protein